MSFDCQAVEQEWQVRSIFSVFLLILRFTVCLQTCSWSIGRIPKDKAPSMSGTLTLETGLERLHVFPTFQVGFKVMGVALSGLQIDKLDLKNLPNRPYKGFRALTRAGEFDVMS